MPYPPITKGAQMRITWMVAAIIGFAIFLVEIEWLSQWVGR